MQSGSRMQLQQPSLPFSTLTKHQYRWCHFFWLSTKESRMDISEQRTSWYWSSKHGSQRQCLQTSIVKGNDGLSDCQTNIAIWIDGTLGGLLLSETLGDNTMHMPCWDGLWCDGIQHEKSALKLHHLSHVCRTVKINCCKTMKQFNKTQKVQN